MKQRRRTRGIFVDNIKEFSQDWDLERLDKALEALFLLDRRKCQIVELRYFGGLTLEETARVLKTTPEALKREWSIAKAWLLRNMNESI